MNVLTPILACPMCMSGVDGKMLVAANSAILALFVVLMAVLASFLSFIFYLVRRSRKFAEIVTPELP